MSVFDIFRKKPIEVKESAVQSFIYQFNGAKAEWTPSEYPKQAKAAYQSNVIAYKCIQEISAACSTIPFKVYKNDEEITNSPLITLLKRPNPDMSWTEFMVAIKTYQKIGGEVFIEAVKSGDIPIELYVHRPDRFRIKENAHGIEAYVFTINGVKKTFPVDRVTGISENILHIKQFNPLDDFYGMSNLKPAAYSIDLHNSIQEWNKSLLDNGCRPSGVLSGEITPDQALMLKSQLEEGFAGSSKSGRPLVIGNLKWEQTGLSPQDMDYLEAKNSTARDIASAFGVPPQMLGIPGDNTYNNMKEARLSFYENTIMFEITRIEEELNRWLVPMFDEKLELKFDWNAVPAIAEKKEMLWSMLNKANFITINEKRSLLGFDPIDGGDVLDTPDNTNTIDDNTDNMDNTDA